MRLNEDEPSVWRDERTKVRTWEVRKGIWRAGRRNAKKALSKESADGLWLIKMKLRVGIES